MLMNFRIDSDNFGSGGLEIIFGSAEITDFFVDQVVHCTMNRPNLSHLADFPVTELNFRPSYLLYCFEFP